MRPKQDLSHHHSDVSEWGYTILDLQYLYGLSRHLAARAVKEAGGLDLPPCTSREVPLVPAHPEIAALTASSSDVAGLTFTHRLYVRARSLNQPVSVAASYLGTDHYQTVDTLHPIIAHALISDGSVKPHLTSAAAQQVVDDAWTELGADFFSEHWTDAADVWVLGDPLQISLPLGYAGRGGIAGTRHHYLSDLQSSAVLKGTPTA